MFVYYIQRERKRGQKISMRFLKSNLVPLITPVTHLAEGEIFRELASEKPKWWSRIHLMNFNVNNIPNNVSWVIAQKRSNFLHSPPGYIIHITESNNGTNVWEKLQWNTLPGKRREPSYLIIKGLEKKKVVRVKKKENVACDKKLLNFWTRIYVNHTMCHELIFW